MKKVWGIKRRTIPYSANCIDVLNKYDYNILMLIGGHTYLFLYHSIPVRLEESFNCYVSRFYSETNSRN